MDPSLLGFALAAGLVAAVNPCGFAMLPAYLALVVLGDDETIEGRGRGGPVGRALTATVLMAIGFLLVFGAFGLVLAPLADTIQRYLPVVTVVVGVLMVALGAWLLTGRELTVLLPRSGRGAPTSSLGSMVGYGIAYAAASLSCTIGPFLAVTAASFGAGTVLGGVAAYVAYALGMTLVVGVLAVVVALAGRRAATRARRLLPYVHRVSGLLLVVVGLYVGYYGIFEYRQNSGAATGTDPIVDAAGMIQQTLAGWVQALGALPIAVALVVLVLAALLARRRHRSAREGSTAETDTGTDTRTDTDSDLDARPPP